MTNFGQRHGKKAEESVEKQSKEKKRKEKLAKKKKVYIFYIIFVGAPNMFRIIL